MTEPGDIAAALQKLDVGDVWGIGRKLVKKLNFMGIFTAAELAAAPRALIRQSFGILTEKTLQELNGISCIELEDAKIQKSILCSRSFETEINSFENLKKSFPNLLTAPACASANKTVWPEASSSSSPPTAFASNATAIQGWSA